MRKSPLGNFSFLTSLQAMLIAYDYGATKKTSLTYIREALGLFLLFLSPLVFEQISLIVKFHHTNYLPRIFSRSQSISTGFHQFEKEVFVMVRENTSNFRFSGTWVDLSVHKLPNSYKWKEHSKGKITKNKTI